MIPSSSSFNLRDITTYQAGIAQSTAHRLLQKECDTYLKEFGITKMQWLIIGTVLDTDERGIRITELAKILYTGLPYLTATVNLLESKGILQRAPTTKDGRAKVVTIARPFLPKCARIEQTLRRKLRESLYAKVSPEEFAIYMKVLYRIGQS